MKSFLALAPAIALIALTACGGGGGTTTPPVGANPQPTTPAQQTPASMPMTATVAAATAFVSSSNGHTLYTFAADTANVSNCGASNGCSSIWPAYTAPAGTIAPAGTGFGLIARSDGSMQWTYSNFPLYQYAGDSAAGQANGQGINSFGGIWGVARPVPSGSSTPNPGGCIGYSC